MIYKCFMYIFYDPIYPVLSNKAIRQRGAVSGVV